MKNKYPTCKSLKDTRAYQCSACRMKYNHPRKNNGAKFRLSTNGYVMIMHNNKEYYEHRYIMEKYLERLLEPDEIVHHCDEDKRHNDIENLELMLKGYHHKHHLTSEKAKEISKLGHKKRWNYVI